MSTPHLINVPKSPRTKTDEELALSCGSALGLEDAIKLAELNVEPWIMDALNGDPIQGRGRMVAALFAVYGAQLEILRLAVREDPVLARLEPEIRETLMTKSALDRESRHAVSCALYEIGRIQRHDLDERRKAFNLQREQARLEAGMPAKPHSPSRLRKMRRVVISGAQA